MRKDIGCAILCGLLCGGAFSVASVAKEYQGTDATGLQVHVPFEPTAFTSPHRDYSAYKLAPPKVDEPLRLQHVETSDSQQRNSKPGAASIHLSYELLLTNIGSAPLTLTRIEIADASRRNAPPRLHKRRRRRSSPHKAAPLAAACHWPAAERRRLVRYGRARRDGRNDLSPSEHFHIER